MVIDGIADMVPSMMRIALPVALLVSGCSLVPGTDSHKRAEAQEAISALLTDPPAAQFRSVAVEASNGTVCGEVNARTVFGGYSGFHRFIRSESRNSALIEVVNTTPSMFAINWKYDCPTNRTASNDV